MIRNHFKIAFRNIWKNKIFSGINILGLSAGLACCILIYLFIAYEFSFDKFNSNAKQIYRITSVMPSEKGNSELAVTPAPWVPLMKKDYPEIKEYTRLLRDEKVLIGEKDKQHYYETQMLYADSTLFNVFSIELEQGQRTHALEKPNSIVLTKKQQKNTLGKKIQLEEHSRSIPSVVTSQQK